MLKKISSLFENFYIGIDTPTKEDIASSNIIKENVSNYTYTTIAFPLIKYEKNNCFLNSYFIYN